VGVEGGRVGADVHCTRLNPRVGSTRGSHLRSSSTGSGSYCIYC